MNDKKKNFFMYVSEILSLTFLIVIILLVMTITYSTAQAISVMFAVFGVNVVLLAMSLLLGIAKYCEISFIEAFVMVLTEHVDFLNLNELDRLSEKMKRRKKKLE